MTQALTYLSHYPTHLQDSIRQLIQQKQLGNWLRQRYGSTHTVNSNDELRQYEQSSIWRQAAYSQSRLRPTYIYLPRARQQTKAQTRTAHKCPIQAHTRAIFEHDSGARTRPLKRKATQQSLLPTLPTHAARLSPSRIRRESLFNWARINWPCV